MSEVLNKISNFNSESICYSHSISMDSLCSKDSNISSIDLSNFLPVTILDVDKVKKVIYRYKSSNSIIIINSS
jgi:hypothetical protein